MSEKVGRRLTQDEGGGDPGRGREKGGRGRAREGLEAKHHKKMNRDFFRPRKAARDASVSEGGNSVAAGTWNKDARTRVQDNRGRKTKKDLWSSKPDVPVPMQTGSPLPSLPTFWANLQYESYDTHFTGAETEAQRGADTCLGQPRLQVAESGTNPGLCGPMPRLLLPRDAELRGERVRRQRSG